jgi:glycosyltransferase involved in cell wall biosynthesis
MGRRRVYLHPNRWTSLGLSLIEAMTLGMPVVALAATAAPETVPADAGVVSCDMTRLRNALCTYISNPDIARRCGEAARRFALSRFGLERFLDDWDRVLERVAA